MPPKRRVPGDTTPAETPTEAPPETPPVENPEGNGLTGEVFVEDTRPVEEIKREQRLRGAAQLKVAQEQLVFTRAVGKRGEGKNSWRTRDEAQRYEAAFYKDDDGEAALKALMDKAMSLYDAKPGDVLTEMAENLRFPDTTTDTATASDDDEMPAADREAYATFEKEARLGMVARELAKSVRGSQTYGTPLELLVIRQATQSGPDIDRDLGFTDAPHPRRRYDGAPEADIWNEYAEAHSNWETSQDSGGRNAAIFPLLNDDAEMEKWAKWLCTFWALAPGNPTHPTHGKATNTDIYVSFGGGEVPKETIDTHRAANPGDTMCWTAPRTATLLKRDAMHAARGDAGTPTEENPGSLIFTLRGASQFGKTASQVSQYPEENAMLIPPFTMYTVAGNAMDAGNTTGEGLLMELRPRLPEGAERGGVYAEFLQRVRNDAILASERLQNDKRRRMEEVDPNNRYTYAEKRVGGHRHTSIPFDTAWQEMLWVVERAEEVADDSCGWVGDRSARPIPGLAEPPTRHLQRTQYAWPPPSANPQAVSPTATRPATNALAHHSNVAAARYGGNPVLRPESIQVETTPPSAPSSVPEAVPQAGGAFPYAEVASQIGQARDSAVPWEGGRRRPGSPRNLGPQYDVRGPVGPAYGSNPQAAVPAYGTRRYEAAPADHGGSIPRDHPMIAPARGGAGGDLAGQHSARWNPSRRTPTVYPVVYPSGRGI